MYKEIVKYPFGLKFVYGGDLTKQFTYDGISYLFGDYCLHVKENNKAYPVNLCYPLLRPREDLLKEIEIDGKKVFALALICNLPEFAELVSVGYQDKKYFCAFGIGDEIIRYEFPVDFASWRSHNLDKLLEMRFDVFGLIDKGKAININTL